MSWLTVDKDGIEAVFRRKPKRIKTTNKWNDAVEKLIGKTLTWADDPYKMEE